MKFNFDHLLNGFARRIKEIRSADNGIIRGFLDFPLTESHQYVELQVVGWAVSSQGKISRVELFVDGRPMGTIPYGVRRKDVREVLPEIPFEDCGYSGYFDLPEVATDTQRRIEVQISDEKGNQRAISRWILQKAALDFQGFRRVNDYALWQRRFDRLAPERRAALAGEIDEWTARPIISVLMPVYNVEEKWLRRCLDSVREQVYPYWELCIADDASPREHIQRVLSEYMELDPRIKCVFREVNGHISECSNSALALATGRYVALLDHDDELHPEALYRIAERIIQFPDAMLLYSDEDKMDENGRRYGPYFKSDWNYELLLSQNMVSHLGVYETARMREIGGFRKGYEGSQDYDLALRFIETIAPEQIHHIPRVLYHWRAVSGSTALGPEQKDYAAMAGQRAVVDHFARTERGGQVLSVEGHGTMQRLHFAVPSPAPMVSLLLRLTPLRADAESLLRTLAAHTEYAACEFLLLSENESSANHATEIFPENSIVEIPSGASYARACNLAARVSRGRLLCLLDVGLIPLASSWLSEMVSALASLRAGIVGAKILDESERIFHAGVVPRADGSLLYPHAGWESGTSGYFGRACLLQRFSAVTGGCLLVCRDLYEHAGGLDEQYESSSYADVDLCLRIKSLGSHTLWTPNAVLRRSGLESPAGAPSPADRSLLQNKWAEILPQDPAYNPNLSDLDGSFSLAWPPRHRAGAR